MKLLSFCFVGLFAAASACVDSPTWKHSTFGDTCPDYDPRTTPAGASVQYGLCDAETQANCCDSCQALAATGVAPAATGAAATGAPAATEAPAAACNGDDKQWKHPEFGDTCGDYAPGGPSAQYGCEEFFKYTSCCESCGLLALASGVPAAVPAAVPADCPETEKIYVDKIVDVCLDKACPVTDCPVNTVVDVPVQGGGAMQGGMQYGYAGYKPIYPDISSGQTYQTDFDAHVDVAAGKFGVLENPAGASSLWGGAAWDSYYLLRPNPEDGGKTMQGVTMAVPASVRLPGATAFTANYIKRLSQLEKGTVTKEMVLLTIEMFSLALVNQLAVPEYIEEGKKIPPGYTDNPTDLYKFLNLFVVPVQAGGAMQGGVQGEPEPYKEAGPVDPNDIPYSSSAVDPNPEIAAALAAAMQGGVQGEPAPYSSGVPVDPNPDVAAAMQDGVQACPTTSTSEGCVDKDPQCPKWAQNGECVANPGSWMMANCAKSCCPTCK